MTALLLAGAVGAGGAAAVDIGRTDAGPTAPPRPQPVTSIAASEFLVSESNLGGTPLVIERLPVATIQGVGNAMAVTKSAPAGCLDPQLSWLSESSGEHLAGEVLTSTEQLEGVPVVGVELTVGTVAPRPEVVDEFIARCDGATWTRGDGSRSRIGVQVVDAPMVEGDPWRRAVEISEAPLLTPGEGQAAAEQTGAPVVLRLIFGVQDGVGVVAVLRPAPVLAADIARRTLDVVFQAQMNLSRVAVQRGK